MTQSGPTTPTSGSDDIWPHRGYAWYVVLMLMLAYTVSILDRIALGLLVQPIEADLHITDTQIGLLQGVAFAIFYTVLGLPLGLLADRTSRRWIVTTGLTVWSAATVACGLARGFPALFASRIALGAGEATLGPAGLSLIADYFPPTPRARAFSVYLIGASMGTGLSLLLGGSAIHLAEQLRLTGPALLSHFAAWKIVFIMLGAPGLLIALLFALTVREPDRRGRGGVVASLSFGPLFSLLRSQWRLYLGLIGSVVFSSVLVFALLGWFPTVMIRLHGWSAATTGVMLGAYSLPCSLISCLSAGWILVELKKRGWSDAPIIMAMAATALVVAAGIFACLAPTPGLAVVGYCFTALATNCFSVALLTSTAQVTPNAVRGQMSALSLLAAGLIAQTSAPFLVGFLADHVFGRALGLGKALATVMAVSGVLCFACLASIRLRFGEVATNADGIQ